MELNDIKKIVVVGAGTMGHSIAQVFAQCGYQVSLVDREEEILKRAMVLIESNLDTLVVNGLVDGKDVPDIIGRIRTITSLEEGAKGSDLAVEAVFENPEVKKKVFSDLDRFCPERAILTSNTSTLDIYSFVETGRPEKVVIAHWFAPPHIIPLVEVVKGERTSMETVELVMQVMRRLGKRPVFIKQFMPSFIVNRIQLAIYKAVFEMLDNGWATPEEIDIAIKASLGIRLPIVGVAQTWDFTGLDLVKAIGDLQGIPSRTVDALVAKGHLGAKTGRGLYDYKGRSLEEVLRKRDNMYLKMVTYLDKIGAYEAI